jgi:hypothetical protein
MERNRQRNGCHFSVGNGALGYGDVRIRFYPRADFLTGSLQASSGGSVAVPAVTLGLLLDRWGLQRCSLICDIEGGEVDLVRLESDVLARRVATLILETHGRTVGNDVTEAMMAALEAAGFEVLHSIYGKSRTDGVYVFANRNESSSQSGAAG